MQQYLPLVRLYIFVLSGLLPALLQLHAADITWQGNSSNNWTTPANWIGGVVPGAADRAFIPVVSGAQSYPVIAAVAGTIRYLEVQNNAQLTLASGGSLTVNGTGCSGGTCYGIYIRNNAALTIQQGATLAVQNTGSYGIYNNEGHFINNGTVSVTATSPSGNRISVNTIDGQVGLVLSEQPKQNPVLPQFTIYPVPASNQLNLNTAGKQVTSVSLFSNQGNLLQTMMPEPFSPLITIDTRLLAPGLYVLQISTPQGIVTQKVPVVR